MPHCDVKLTDPSWKEVNCEVAHIRGRQPGSACYDPTLTTVELHAFDNLILLCRNCHALVDRLEPQKWPVDRLVGLKAAHDAALRQRSLGNRT